MIAVRRIHTDTLLPWSLHAQCSPYFCRSALPKQLDRLLTKQKEICLRFVDLVSELREFSDRQTTVLVVVEAFDKMQRSILGVMQLVA